MEYTINIFTLNCWGIPVVSKNRKERIEAIAKYLLESVHNVICLQEIWSEKDYLFLKEFLKTTHPHSHYFYSGVLGSGLCVFSKWQIQDVFFHQWPLNGYIHKIHHGDWFGGKGVGLCRIKIDEKLINVYCTHLHAEYHVDDMYLAHRVLQAYSTAEFIHLTSPPADLSILAGDLNTGPGDLAFRLITEFPSLIDPYDLKWEGTNPDISKPSGTCDNANNSYSDPKRIKVSPEGKRIDHILYHVNSSWEVDLLNFGNPLKDRVPNRSFSYSDHNAVCLELRLKQTDMKTARAQRSTDGSFDQTINETIKVSKEAINRLSSTKKLYLMSGSLIIMIVIGTVSFWPNCVLYDVIKIILAGLGFYYIIMGTLWHRIEMNSFKASVSALENFVQSRIQTKDAD